MNKTKKELPCNLKELLDIPLFQVGFQGLLKHKNIKLIKRDGKFGKKIGYFSSKFTDGSLICKINNTILICMIEVKLERKGCFTELIKKIQERGYEIEIISPLNKMINCLIKNKEEFGFELYETWVDEKDNFIASTKKTDLPKADIEYCKKISDKIEKTMKLITKLTGVLMQEEQNNYEKS